MRFHEKAPCERRLFCCLALRFDYSGNMETKEALDVLTSLSQESRLRVFRLLVTASPHGLPAGAIAEELAVPANTLSFHLNHLRHAGLISVRRQGRMQIYAAHCQQVEMLMGFLTENCCTRLGCGTQGETP